ncbi:MULTISPECIES: hypothetical protein [unclassified Helicobacter]|uniref:hypothetical protein n=1 Tax=unclassified Helicobacter TaxID=2593540 RepID=UPI000CF15C0D|nr:MULTISPECIES: hypothetical protein [unclassified Helicobacter]
MKKIFIFCITSLLLWSSDVKENIIKTFKIEEIDVQVIEVKELNSGLSIAIIQQNNGVRIPIFTTNDGKNVMGIAEPLIFSSDHYQDIMRDVYKEVMDYNKQRSDKAILENLNQNAWINFKGNAKSGSVYLILDANCKYCKQEFSKIDQLLKDYKEIKVVFCGLLGLNSLQKAAQVYQDIKSITQQKDKIAYLKKIFSDEVKISDKLNTDFIQKINQVAIDAGITGVPYIIIK